MKLILVLALGFVLGTGLVLSACSQDSPKRSAPGVAAPEVSTPADVGSDDEARFCDEGASANPNSELRAIADFVDRLKKQKMSLTPSQCIAIAAYAVEFDGWGEACKGRGVKQAIRSIDTCEETYLTPEGSEYSCILYGQDGDAIFPHHEKKQEFLGHNVNDCMWTEDETKQKLTAQVIEAAKIFVRTGK
jgi:hypothetical protein